MPFRTVPGTTVEYALIAFDKEGVERIGDPDAKPVSAGGSGKFSARVVEQLASRPYTNVFFFSHGWKGDVPAAIEQYDHWIGAMAADKNDQQQMKALVPNFLPLWIGVHWPSQPWGDEEIGPAGAAFDILGSGPSLATLQAEYLERLGDTPAIRAALDIIFNEARHNAAATALTPAVRQAYVELNTALGLDTQGEGAAPGDDRAAFDPDVAFQAGDESVAFGGSGWNFGGILSPLRQLSFWTMKKRANTVGEGGMYQMLSRMLTVTAGRGTHFHLMGHSFGCIVVSSMMGGPGGNAPLPRPVSSVALVQGAFSLWGYSPDIPRRRGTPGYFARTLAMGKVAGPLITTQSRFDTAVGKFYPIGSGLAGQVVYDLEEDGLPTFGGVGAFGIRGLPAGGSVQTKMLPASGAYSFAPGKVYNLDSNDFINHGDGASGAHSDISGPEVAHAIWQAAIAGSRS